MATFRLMKSQTDEIFEIIASQGFDPQEFSWKSVKSSFLGNTDIDSLTHEPTSFYFMFESRLGTDHFAIFSPGRETSIEKQNSVSWENQIEYVKFWLKYLKRELESPSYWARLAEHGETISPLLAIADLERAFTDEEKTSISAALNRIEQNLKEIAGDDEGKLTLIANEIQYLKEKADKFSVKDWILLATGTLLGLATQIGLDAVQVQEIFGILQDGIGGVISFLP